MSAATLKPAEENVTSGGTARAALLFALVVLGIMAHWFWGIGWQYLGNVAHGFQIGPVQAVIVRVGLSLIAAAPTFATIYQQVNQTSRESWLPYLFAFQNGFFWEAMFATVARQFGVTAPPAGLPAAPVAPPAGP